MACVRSSTSPCSGRFQIVKQKFNYTLELGFIRASKTTCCWALHMVPYKWMTGDYVVITLLLTKSLHPINARFLTFRILPRCFMERLCLQNSTWSDLSIKYLLNQITYQRQQSSLFVACKNTFVCHLVYNMPLRNSNDSWTKCCVDCQFRFVDIDDISDFSNSEQDVGDPHQLFT